MSDRFRPRRIGRVLKDHAAPEPSPLEVATGETVEIGRRHDHWTGFVWCTNLEQVGGWVPEEYIDRKGDVGVMRCDYSASELTVKRGEDLVVHKAQSGWLWATNQAGVSGWIPEDIVQLED